MRVQDEQRAPWISLSGSNDLGHQLPEQLGGCRNQQPAARTCANWPICQPAPLEKLESAIVKARMAKYQYRPNRMPWGSGADPQQLLSGDGITLDRGQRAVLRQPAQSARRQLLTRQRRLPDTHFRSRPGSSCSLQPPEQQDRRIRELSASHLFWMPGRPALRQPGRAARCAPALGLLLEPSQLAANLPGPSPENPEALTLAGPRSAGTWPGAGQAGTPSGGIQVRYSPAHPGQGDPSSSLTSRLLIKFPARRPCRCPYMVLMVRGLLDGAWQIPFARWRWPGRWRIWFCCWPAGRPPPLSPWRGSYSFVSAGPKERVQRRCEASSAPAAGADSVSSCRAWPAAIERLHDSLGRLAFIVGALWLLLFFARASTGKKLPLTWGRPTRAAHLLHHLSGTASCSPCWQCWAPCSVTSAPPTAAPAGTEPSGAPGCLLTSTPWPAGC